MTSMQIKVRSDDHDLFSEMNKYLLGEFDITLACPM